MRIHVLERQQRIERPLEQVFPFYADAANLERITPPWLGFELTTPRPIAMERGALIEYRLRLHGVPVRWRTRIEAWEPPHRFVDAQLSGPTRCGITRTGSAPMGRGRRCSATGCGTRSHSGRPGRQRGCSSYGAIWSGSSTTAAMRWRRNSRIRVDSLGTFRVR
ncbi:MAG: cell division inhibitor SulA [Solirubrobacterales bacterium]|nr:cell division inhibitor SulA [Solirubrobacterales bacterium]